MPELELILEPDADEPGAALVFVDGRVNGNPYRFLLDTGAAQSDLLMDAEIAALEPAGTHESSGVFSASQSDLVRIERLEVGPIICENILLTRSPASPETNSLIGMDILHTHCCHFQFDQRRVLLDTGGDDAYAFHPLAMDARRHPYVEVGFAHGAASAVWDTGASLTVVDLGFIQRHPDLFTPAGTSTGTDATGSQVETAMYTMSPAMIGVQQFPATRVAAVDLSYVNARIEKPMDLILGYTMLKLAHWLFDFPRKRWAITKWLGD